MHIDPVPVMNAPFFSFVSLEKKMLSTIKVHFFGGELFFSLFVKALNAYVDFSSHIWQ